jgi:uncharacterized membrane protein
VVVDVGMIYQERRELQNGADAAASAIARDCARQSVAGNQACTADLVGAVATAQEYADAVGADGYAADASTAVRRAKELLAQRRAAQPIAS